VTARTAGDAVQAIRDGLDRDQVALLPPIDVFDTLAMARAAGLHAAGVMLDPWYNKGIGGTVDDDEYADFILRLLTAAAAVGDHVYLWGFPEIVGPLLARSIPDELGLVAWLTWYYKNNPSVIRGWRSAQMTCLHLSRPGAGLHVEHFMNDKQKALQANGKLRYIPGPPSVIESSLLVGFIGRDEQTGHPSQKPEAVYEPLLKMVARAGDLIIDPMCGSGTAGAVARAQGLQALLGDHDASHVERVEQRLHLQRLTLA